MKTNSILMLIGLVLSGLTSNVYFASQAPAASQSRNVVINRVRLTDALVLKLESTYRTRLQDGRYWYDSRSGAWGVEGGPALGIVVAGLNVGGPLRADASNGNTGVFINGRELHQLDVMVLRQLGPVLPGRYWVDAFGNCGFEGGPAFVNLIQLAQSRGGRAWTHYSSSGDAAVGGDGNGFLFFQGKDSAGNITSWSK